MSFLGRFVPPRERALRHGTYAELEENLKYDKNLRFCMAQLDSMLNGNDFDPEQKRALAVARKELKVLWRKPSPRRAEVFRVVRRVAEAILKLFHRD